MARFVLLAGLGCGGAAGCGSPAMARAVELPKERALLPSDVERIPITSDTTSIEADISALGSYTLSFERVRGELSFSPSDPKKSQLAMDVEMGSASSSIEVVADVAKDQFLNVVQHPYGHFTALQLVEEKGQLFIIGQLSLLGVERGIRVPAALEIDECAVTTDTSFTINRRDFGIEATGTLDSVVSDEVVIRVHVAAPRKSAPASCAKRAE